jgi:hypothetical protein
MTEHVINNVPPPPQRRGGAVAPSICVFDVNETLLDIEFLAPLFQRLFAHRKPVKELASLVGYCTRRRAGG